MVWLTELGRIFLDLLLRAFISTQDVVTLPGRADYRLSQLYRRLGNCYGAPWLINTHDPSANHYLVRLGRRHIVFTHLSTKGYQNSLTAGKGQIIIFLNERNPGIHQL